MNPRAVANATLGLLLYAEGNKFSLTTQPIVVEENDATGGWHVTLYAVWPDGSDYQLRLGVENDGILPLALHRFWDGEQMSPWTSLPSDSLQALLAVAS